MTILFFLLSAFLVGLFSRFFYPGKVPMSWLGTLGIGVGSAILGTLIGHVLGLSGVGLIGSILIGVVIIYIYNKYNKEKVEVKEVLELPPAKKRAGRPKKVN